MPRPLKRPYNFNIKSINTYKKVSFSVTTIISYCDQWTHQNQLLLTNRFAQTTMLNNNQLLVSLKYFTKQLLIVNKHFTNDDNFRCWEHGRVLSRDGDRTVQHTTNRDRTNCNTDLQRCLFWSVREPSASGRSRASTSQPDPTDTYFWCNYNNPVFYSWLSNGPLRREWRLNADSGACCLWRFWRAFPFIK